MLDQTLEQLEGTEWGEPDYGSSVVINCHRPRRVPLKDFTVEDLSRRLSDMKTEKTFDCVEMKRRGAEEVQKTLAGMTPEEELAYWQSGTEELRQRQKRSRAESERLEDETGLERPAY